MPPFDTSTVLLSYFFPPSILCFRRGYASPSLAHFFTDKFGTCGHRRTKQALTLLAGKPGWGVESTAPFKSHAHSQRAQHQTTTASVRISRTSAACWRRAWGWRAGKEGEDKRERGKSIQLLFVSDWLA